MIRKSRTPASSGLPAAWSNGNCTNDPSCRSGYARWADIDFDKHIWTIPPERMKKRRPHTIPLTEQALALLETLKPHSGHREYVFPSDRNPRAHANSQTANMALKRMGFQDRLVSHGVRSMASTILNEHGWDPELIEVALAHVDKDEVRSACNRADYIERRRPMMAWWSEHIRKRPLAACRHLLSIKPETATSCRYAEHQKVRGTGTIRIV